MSNRPKKNRSKQDKQRARARAQRREEARLRDHPLYGSPPPFHGYQDWFNVPAGAAELIDCPPVPGLGGDEKDMLDALIKLGPRYEGLVPMAALFLDQQIRDGVLLFAITGDTERYRPVPLADFAAEVCDPAQAEQNMLDHPEWGELAAVPGGADAVVMYLHTLHSKGAFVLDDNHVINLALPPARSPSGTWQFNGHPGEDL
ncbi:hypothetical protein [Nocardia sp. NPDC059228]|uniref:hypothetical protein n=1 Tax=Nocardia sp. NPDC059228 TaxID=3346777 RepID=UPI00369454AA